MDKLEVAHEQERSDFDKALSLLKNNPSELRLDIHLPYHEYLQSEELWSKFKAETRISEDQKYPYLAYNSYAETVTVVTVPRDLHEAAAVELGPMILASAREYLTRNKADASLSMKINNVGSTTAESSTGKYAKSKKQADGTIKYLYAGVNAKIMIAIEVGYSQDNNALLRDKDMWIKGHNV